MNIPKVALLHISGGHFKLKYVSHLHRLSTELESFEKPSQENYVKYIHHKSCIGTRIKSWFSFFPVTTVGDMVQHTHPVHPCLSDDSSK